MQQLSRPYPVTAERRDLREELAEAQSLSRRQQIQQHDKDLPTRGDQLVLRIRPCAPASTDLTDCDEEAKEDVGKSGEILCESAGIGTGSSTGVGVSSLL